MIGEIKSYGNAIEVAVTTRLDAPTADVLDLIRYHWASTAVELFDQGIELLPPRVITGPVRTTDDGVVVQRFAWEAGGVDLGTAGKAMRDARFRHLLLNATFGKESA